MHILNNIITFQHFINCKHEVEKELQKILDVQHMVDDSLEILHKKY